MANQTKIGFVTLILLVGCIFAIPHFRHPLTSRTASESESDSTESMTPLKLKLDPSGDAKKKSVTASATPAPRGLREQKGSDRRSGLVESAEKQVVPSVQREQWKFPPIARPQESVAAASPATPAEPLRRNSQLIARGNVDLERPRPVRLPPEAISPMAESRSVGVQPELPASRQVFPATDNSRTAAPYDRTQRRTVGVARSQLVERQALERNTEPPLHRIVNGDTLENLALQYYGDPRKAMLIFESNRDALLNPAILPLGVDLKIPDVD